MKKVVIIIALIIIVSSVTGFYAKEQFERKQQKEELVSYVNDAVQLIEDKGEAIFPELRSDKWYIGDSYIFVWQVDGLRVVYPPDQSGEGQNMADLKDVNGKPIGKLFIETALEGEGWIDYMWPKPGEQTPVKKITYIKKAEYDNTVYIVGSGIYVK